jgi:hypothetical protein
MKSGLSGDQTVTDVELVELAKIPVVAVPFPRAQVGFKTCCASGSVLERELG